MLRFIAFVPAAASLFACVAGHSAMVIPKPRNAVDGELAPFNGSVPDFDPVSRGYPSSLGNWCPIGKGGGGPKGDTDGELSGENGQSCFWFSNGCSIGCPECLPADPRCPGPTWAHKNTDMCGNKMKPTICDPRLRTFGDVDGKWPECGSAEDKYASTPWRAPGTAPVLDACGMAGGTPKESHSGAQYFKTPHAKQGDLGSKTLKPAPNGLVWEAGGEAEVSWTINANHGGGYQYRLCPRSQPLTEECFQKHPLTFKNGSQTLRWDGKNGTTQNIGGQYVITGTHPRGSSWAKNPIPRGSAFPPPCKEDPKACGGDGHRTKCRCSGAWGPYNLEIVDTVKVPNVPAGEYVVGWRLDCEESAQVWSNCGDVTIKPGGYGGLGVGGTPTTAAEQKASGSKFWR